MKKIIPIIAISIIIIYAGVLLTDKPMQKNSISNQVSEVKEPPLSSIVPKEVPKVTTSPKATPSTTPTKPTTTTPKPSTPTSNPNEYTLAQIATHNSSSSCWTIVNNNVYDLTSFVNEHPGGSGAIKRMCGKDGTSSFTDQHGGQRNPEQELASHKIGTLKK
jgi:cytochrome b involved in lipid metabolism